MFRAGWEQMPDHTIEQRKWEDPDGDHLHTCLVVSTTQPVARGRFTLHAKGKDR